MRSSFFTFPKSGCKSAVYKITFNFFLFKNFFHPSRIYMSNFSSFGQVLTTLWKFEVGLFHAFLLKSQKLWTRFRPGSIRSVFSFCLSQMPLGYQEIWSNPDCKLKKLFGFSVALCVVVVFVLIVLF